MRIKTQGFRRAGIALGALSTVMAYSLSAKAQVPIQVTPYASEPGVPVVTISPSSNPLGGDTDPTSGAGSTTATSSGSDDTGSDALDTLLSQTWGATAVSEAEAVGVNPSALAATCVVESGCTNAGTNGTATGAFQMQPAAYQDGLQTALAADPSLASQIVQGSAGESDPATEAVAAAGYLMQAAQTLQSDNISNPTMLAARSYYEFGPTYGAAVATASPSALMSSVVPSQYLSVNGISNTKTVSQYQASVASKIGSAAYQSVLS